MKKRQRLIIIIVTCLVLVIFGGYFAVRSFAEQHGAIKSDSSDVTPGFKVLSPVGKSIEENSSWLKTPQDGAVFAYNDTIESVPINVTEQSIPASFKDNIPAHIASVANGYNATDKIDAAGTAVYIGTSAKGPQSVIFTKNDLLILIKSYSKVNNAAWAEYVKSLN